MLEEISFCYNSLISRVFLVSVSPKLALEITMPYTVEQLSDLQCIRDTALRYCRGVDRLDEDLMKSAYWPDATDNHGTFIGNAM